MGNIVPPPSTGIPAVYDTKEKKRTMDFTPAWRKWFIDLAKIINASGGTSGSVSASRTINTTSPLTGGGNLTADRTISLGTQSANTILAGPTSGAAAAPSFRALVAADLPGQTHTVTLAKITAGGTNGSLTFTNGILTAYTDPT